MDNIFNYPKKIWIVLCIRIDRMAHCIHTIAILVCPRIRNTTADFAYYFGINSIIFEREQKNSVVANLADIGIHSPPGCFSVIGDIPDSFIVVGNSSPE